MLTTEQLAALSKLRMPFPENQISLLPKGMQRDGKRAQCRTCGGFHAPAAVHLRYVGHAALTDRLLDVDLKWDWEPLASTAEGLPLFDSLGGLWIKLTVAGMTRKGYGHAQDKTGGDAIKEVIGDAMRNAAMRFGCALDLWHKGELHAEGWEPPAPIDQTITTRVLVCQPRETLIEEPAMPTADQLGERPAEDDQNPPAPITPVDPAAQRARFRELRALLGPAEVLAVYRRAGIGDGSKPTDAQRASILAEMEEIVSVGAKGGVA